MSASTLGKWVLYDQQPKTSTLPKGVDSQEEVVSS